MKQVVHVWGARHRGTLVARDGNDVAPCLHDTRRTALDFHHRPERVIPVTILFDDGRPARKRKAKEGG